MRADHQMDIHSQILEIFEAEKRHEIHTVQRLKAELAEFLQINPGKISEARRELGKIWSKGKAAAFIDGWVNLLELSTRENSYKK